MTIEPFYDRGEFDVNILPIVYQSSLTRRLDIRYNSIVNLGVRKEGNEISHIGFETGLPIFFKQKENKNDISKGFFIAPILSATRNRIAANYNLGLWIEPGFNLLFDNNFAMSFGVQLGGTNFNNNNVITGWQNHFGIKVILGIWL